MARYEKDGCGFHCAGAKTGRLLIREFSINDFVKRPKLLLARLEKVSHVQGIAPSAIARKAIAEHLSYLGWKERAIARGDADHAAGRVLITAQVFSVLAQQRATFGLLRRQSNVTRSVRKLARPTNYKF